jgi:ribosomal protein S12 methylthiotransferase accessory factor
VPDLQAAGLDVTLVELTHDIGVPVFRAILSDSSFPGHEGRRLNFDGLGCDLDPGHALLRAVCEAVQSHAAVLVGARDEFEGGIREPLSTTRFIDWLVAPSAVQPFAAGVPDGLPDDLVDRLLIVLDRLRAARFTQCVAVDLTRPQIGVPVVRVLLPGAAGPPGDTARRPPLRLLRELV